ncbi:hypothetical protein EIQ17_22355 [Xanthomonas campestris pv. campestris]
MSRADERQRGKVVGVWAFASFSLLHGFAGGIRMGVWISAPLTGDSRQPSDEKTASPKAVFSFSGVYCASSWPTRVVISLPSIGARPLNRKQSPCAQPLHTMPWRAFCQHAIPLPAWLQRYVGFSRHTHKNSSQDRISSIASVS